jgi:hypothetical protein
MRLRISDFYCFSEGSQHFIYADPESNITTAKGNPMIRHVDESGHSFEQARGIRAILSRIPSAQ